MLHRVSTLDALLILAVGLLTLFFLRAAGASGLLPWKGTADAMTDVTLTDVKDPRTISRLANALVLAAIGVAIGVTCAWVALIALTAWRLAVHALHAVHIL